MEPAQSVRRRPPRRRKAAMCRLPLVRSKLKSGANSARLVIWFHNSASSSFGASTSHFVWLPRRLSSLCRPRRAGVSSQASGPTGCWAQWACRVPASSRVESGSDKATTMMTERRVGPREQCESIVRGAMAIWRQASCRIWRRPPPRACLI